MQNKHWAWKPIYQLHHVIIIDNLWLINALILIIIFLSKWIIMIENNGYLM